MKIRLYNARVLPMQNGLGIIRGEVHTDGGRITYVGTGKHKAGSGTSTAGSGTVFDREIDCGGNLLMPGFKNAHTHSAMTFLRSRADDLPLQLWLNEQVFPYEARLTGEDIYTLTELAILEYLTSGITSIMDMYLTPDTIARACQERGMRCVQVGAANNHSMPFERVREWFETLNGVHPLTSFCLGIHAEYTCLPSMIEKVADLAAQHKAPVFAHCAETLAETVDCTNRYGKPPAAFLASMGLWDHGGAGYHMIYVTEDEMKTLKKLKVGVVTNPSSNMKLASGMAPLTEYLERGIPVAIGTDGPASNNCLDMFREMFLTTALNKIRTGHADAVPAGKVIKMAASTGAHIMQIPDADMLAPGKLADMILLDLHQPNMQPIHNITSNIVYSGSKANVMMTMINGEILYDTFEGRPVYHVGKEPEEIYRKSQEITDRICYH